VKFVSESTLDEFRTPGACELCGKLCRKREAFHLLARGRDNGTRMDIPENLLGSCTECHHRHHTSGAMQYQAADVIGAREGLHADDLLAVVRRLRLASEWEWKR
jgi:cytochrome c553